MEPGRFSYNDTCPHLLERLGVHVQQVLYDALLTVAEMLGLV
jgi:chromosome condensin MukBEF MukE localization factor